MIQKYVQEPNKLRLEFDPKTGLGATTHSLTTTISHTSNIKEEEKQSSYLCGDANLTERFNPNNKEMNTRRFWEQNAQILKNR